jgi:general secretion pathway protein G
MKKAGFTLIELLVVISIIGILAGLTLASYSGAQKQTRDTERRSDLAQYRNSLENYAANNNGLYIGRTTRTYINTGSTFCNTLTTPGFISSCPVDPINDAAHQYYYRSDGSNDYLATATKYVLWVRLETEGFWEVCSDGRSGKLTTSPNAGSGQGDINGTCQLP